MPDAYWGFIGAILGALIGGIATYLERKSTTRQDERKLIRSKIEDMYYSINWIEDELCNMNSQNIGKFQNELRKIHTITQLYLKDLQGKIDKYARDVNNAVAQVNQIDCKLVSSATKEIRSCLEKHMESV